MDIVTDLRIGLAARREAERERVQAVLVACGAFAVSLVALLGWMLAGR